MERFAIIYLEIYDENNNRENGRVEAGIYVWTTRRCVRHCDFVDKKCNFEPNRRKLIVWN
jgi:hypothetical protein